MVTQQKNEDTRPKKNFEKVSSRFCVTHQPGSGGETPSYWCERLTGGNIKVKRDIVEFGVKYVDDLVEEYENK